MSFPAHRAAAVVLVAAAALGMRADGAASAREDAGAEELDRRAAEQLLRRADPADVARALEALDSADRHVRARLARYLGQRALGTAQVERRVAELAAVARTDGDPAVRRAAVESLARLDQAPAAAALAELVAELPSDEQNLAAKELAGMLRGGAAIEGVVAQEWTRRASGGARIGPEAFGELLIGLGSALAEVGEAALAPERYTALLAGLLSPAADERAGARAGVENALARWVWLERAELARRFLERIAADGFAGDALVLRAAQIALAEEGDPAAARRLARQVGAKWGPSEGDVAAELTLRARLVEAAAEIAAGAPDAALVVLGAARSVGRELVALRLERDAQGGPGTRADVEAAVEAQRLLVLVDVWELTAELVTGADAAAPPQRERARAVHRGLLAVHRAALDWEANGVGGTFDDVLEGEFAPRRLLGLDERHAGLPRARWLDVQRQLGRALALVAPRELPGFLGADELALAENPLEDPERLVLLRSLRFAEMELVQRRIADDRANRFLWLRQLELLREQFQKDEAAGFPALLDYRTPSAAALVLSVDLRGDGDPAAARTLARALEEALGDGRGGPLWREWTLARIHMAVGAASTDLGEGDVARAELDRAVVRLEALQRELEDQLAELDAGNAPPTLGSDPAAERRRMLRGQIELTRGLLADAFVSLAVNANVRAKDVDAAVAHFERAFELRQGDFMVVLLACYRARAGRADEARALLVDVHDAPALHYNMACSYALLGEEERALDYLARTFESSVRSEGARARQREWARDDPDLVSLREHPRFVELTAP